jgi:hypothetical protein
MITETPVDEVPNFCTLDSGEKNVQWWPDTSNWLLERGWVGILILQEAWEKNLACVYAAKASGTPIIVSGKSPRFDCDHCVVMAGDRFFDPHPDDANIVGEIKEAVIIFKKPSTKERDCHE